MMLYQALFLCHSTATIFYIRGVKAHLLDENTTQTLCVWYVFRINSQLNPRLGKVQENHASEPSVQYCLQTTSHTQWLGPCAAVHSQWTFSLDGIVVDPGHTYSISVFHLPEPDQEHYRINKRITVPRKWGGGESMRCLSLLVLW